MIVSPRRIPYSWSVILRLHTHPGDYDTHISTSLDASSSSDEKHFEFQFSDETCKFYCCVFHAKEFHDLRTTVLGTSNRDFVSSLSECLVWVPTGGKSGAHFFKTADDRFILKNINQYEIDCVTEKFGPSYCDHVRKAQAAGKHTCLAKIYGVFRIGFKNSASTGKSLKLDLVVTENLMYSRTISKSYDLKGSIRNRYMDTSGNYTFACTPAISPLQFPHRLHYESIDQWSVLTLALLEAAAPIVISLYPPSLSCTPTAIVSLVWVLPNRFADPPGGETSFRRVVPLAFHDYRSFM